MCQLAMHLGHLKRVVLNIESFYISRLTAIYLSMYLVITEKKLVKSEKASSILATRFILFITNSLTSFFYHLQNYTTRVIFLLLLKY